MALPECIGSLFFAGSGPRSVTFFTSEPMVGTEREGERMDGRREEKVVVGKIGMKDCWIDGGKTKTEEAGGIRSTGWPYTREVYM